MKKEQKLKKNKETKIRNFDDFGIQEPLKSNRFLINLEGVNIPQYLFRDYKIYNEGENLIFKTSFFETVNYIFNPKDFFNIISVKIEYLDPIGNVINGITFDVKGSNFKINQSYSKDNIQTTKLRFIINTNSIRPLFNNDSVIIHINKREDNYGRE